MLQGLGQWEVTPLVTVGELLPSQKSHSVEGQYQPVGSMDGLGAYLVDADTARVLVNHELSRQAGAPYRLQNGLFLTGSRVSFVDIHRKTKRVINSGLAYDTVFDRQGQVVTQPLQINQTHDKNQSGFSRFCSAQLIPGGRFGFADTIFFTHEEAPDPVAHPHGGTMWALDVDSNRLYGVPSVGRMSFENSAPLAIGGERIALLIGDDTVPQSDEPFTFGQGATADTPSSHIVAAPLWLFIGIKNASFFEMGQAIPLGIPIPAGDFLNRNGLFAGSLYYFVASNGQTAVKAFHGTGTRLAGTWKKIEVFDNSKARQPGYDQWGYKDGFTLRREAKAGGAFQFSRPEDVGTHPRIGTRAVLASTGSDRVFPKDAWGTIYQVDVNFDSMSAMLTILYDGDDAGGGQVAGPDFGIRNPDNVEWAEDGFVYVQEDNAKGLDPWFGSQSGEEASVWQLDPQQGTIERVAQINRNIFLGENTSDRHPDIIGAWESTGILDVTSFLGRQPGEKVFLASVQAHSVRDGFIAKFNLVESGQLVLLSYREH